MDLSSVAMGAASAVNQNYAALTSAIAAAGQNPNANSVAGQQSAVTPAQASMDVLKQAIDFQASNGAQLAALINATGVDITA
jgi:hypothetical protein